MGALAGPALSLDHALLFADVRRSKQQAQLIGHSHSHGHGHGHAARAAPQSQPQSQTQGQGQGQGQSPSSLHVAAAASLSSSRLSRLFSAPLPPPDRDPLGPPLSVYGGDYRPPAPFVPRVLPSALTHPSPVMTFWMNQMETEKVRARALMALLCGCCCCRHVGWSDRGRTCGCSSHCLLSLRLSLLTFLS